MNLIFSMRYLVISALFVRNNYFYLKILLLVSLQFCLVGCGESAKMRQQRIKTSTQIICPDGKKYLIRHAYAAEVKNAIAEDLKRKKERKSSENYTVIRIPNIESFHIPKMPPEKTIECIIEQNTFDELYPDYILSF